MPHPIQRQANAAVRQDRPSPRSMGRGFSLLEVLIAVAIMSFGILPILSLGSRGVETTRAQTARIAMTLLVQALMDRLAGPSVATDLYPLLTPIVGNPNVWHCDDILPAVWSNGALASDLLPAKAWIPLLRAHDAHIEVTLTRRVIPSADTVDYRATWWSERSGARVKETLLQSRLLVDGGA